MHFVLESAPISFAMIGQLAPVHLQGIMMGTWMLLIGVGASLAGYFSNKILHVTQSIDPLITNINYSHTFDLLGWFSIAVGIIIFISTKHFKYNWLAS